MLKDQSKEINENKLTEISHPKRLKELLKKHKKERIFTTEGLKSGKGERKNKEKRKIKEIYRKYIERGKRRKEWYEYRKEEEREKSLN